MWKVFEERAEEYDRWYDKNRDIFRAEVNCVKRLIKKPCVEIGAGTGRFALELNAVGLDISKEMLKIARRRGVEVIRGDASLLPFKRESVECFVMIVTLCFLGNPQKAIEEARVCLKKNGSIVICIVPADSTLGVEYAEKKRDSPFYSVAHFYSINELVKLLDNFEITDMSGMEIKGENDFLCVKAVKR